MDREKNSLNIKLTKYEPSTKSAATRSTSTGSSAAGSKFILAPSSLHPSQVPATLQANSRAAQAAMRVDLEDGGGPMKPRPVSLSSSLHCRLELWFNEHGYEAKDPTPAQQRIFDTGHMIEAAMFDGVAYGRGESPDVIGPWWPTLGTLVDPVTSFSINAGEWEVTNRQHEVELFGYKGHIDCLLRRGTDIILPDCKTAASFAYLKEGLDGVFTREYVGQLHAYRLGLIAEGITPAAMILLYYSKSTSEIAFRYVAHDPAIDAEIEERLGSVKHVSPPRPDYQWVGGMKPLRCRYCPQAENCEEHQGCQCGACRPGKAHLSSCAVHNMPATANGPCDCQ